MKFYKEAYNIYYVLNKIILSPYLQGILNNIGGIYHEQSNYKEALYYFHKSLELRQKFNKDKSPELSLCLYNISIYYRSIGQYELAKQYSEESLEILEEIYEGKLNYRIAGSFINLSSLAIGLGDNQKALELNNSRMKCNT